MNGCTYMNVNVCECALLLWIIISKCINGGFRPPFYAFITPWYFVWFHNQSGVPQEEICEMGIIKSALNHINQKIAHVGEEWVLNWYQMSFVETCAFVFKPILFLESYIKFAGYEMGIKHHPLSPHKLALSYLNYKGYKLTQSQNRCQFIPWGL